MNKTSIAAIAIALTSVLAGQAMAAAQATDTTSQQVAVATTAKPAAEPQGKASSTDAFADLDKIKKW